MLCSCGNSLPPSRCCESKINSKSWSGIAKKVTVGQALQTASQALIQRNLQIASCICQLVLKHLPHHPKALYLSAMVQFSVGQSGRAQALMETAFAHGLKEPAAHLQYANMVGQQGLERVALEHLKKAVELQPRFEAAWSMGVKLAAMVDDIEGRLFFALGWQRHFPLNHQSWLALADALHQVGEDDKAIALLAEAAQHFPADHAFTLRLAGILELRNQMHEAMTLVDEVLAKQVQPAALLLKGRLLRREGLFEQAFAALAQCQDHVLDDALQIELLHELSQLYRLQGNYPLAWQHACDMKAQKRRLALGKGALDDIERVLSAIEKQYSKSCGYTQVASPSEKHQWLFLVGFPRVGSTLLEKLIVEQYECLDVGESQALMAMERQLGQQHATPWWAFTPAQWQRLVPDQLLDDLNTEYARTAKERPQQAILDKQLFNLARLPLIAQLAPKTPVIYVIRHPLDTLVSCHFANFANQDTWHMDLVLAARYMARLDQFWLAISGALPSPVFTLRYEDLVQDKCLSASLREFLDSHWQARQKDAKGEAKTFITRTASYAQVSGRISETSVGNYRHYLELIPSECIHILNPMMTRWGYTA